MRIVLLSSLLIASGLAVAAGTATARPQRDAIKHPTAPARVVLRVSSGGGFVTPQTNLRALPSFTLYGDGTVIVPGPIIQIYPGPALYPLVRSKLDERAVQALLQRARLAGLLAPRAIDYGGMGAVGVSDMPTTTLLVNAAGKRFKRQAYALGATAQGGRLSPAQARARRALQQFIAGLPHGAPGTVSRPHAIAVYVTPFRGQAQPGAAPIVWPLKSNLATAGNPVSSGLGYRCISVGGKDARTLLATLRKANEQSRWTARAGAKAAYQLIARPLLPDERGCPPPAG
jgi:hypothetical protein